MDIPQMSERRMQVLIFLGLVVGLSTVVGVVWLLSTYGSSKVYIAIGVFFVVTTSIIVAYQYKRARKFIAIVGIVIGIAIPLLKYFDQLPGTTAPRRSPQATRPAPTKPASARPAVEAPPPPADEARSDTVSDSTPGVPPPALSGEGMITLVLRPGEPQSISIPVQHRGDYVGRIPSGWTRVDKFLDSTGNAIVVYAAVRPAKEVRLTIAIRPCVSAEDCAW